MGRIPASCIYIIVYLLSCTGLKLSKIFYIQILIFGTLSCLLGAANSGSAEQKGCVSRYYGDDSIVCVCNATYCDTLEAPQKGPIGAYALYSSSKDGLRFRHSTGNFSSTPSKESKAGTIVFTVDRTIRYQKVIGFGGAMTDAAGINIASLSEGAQDLLLRSYFSEEGLEFNVVRIPMGGSDFSTRPYSYDDESMDVNLTHFKLAKEDTKYKIPFLERLIKMSPKEILLFGSVWSAPKWMKTNGDFIGKGRLKDEYYQLWADYFIKFLNEYESRGFKFWGITTQNEPTDGNLPNFSFNCMGWTADQTRKWVAENLGPTLHANGYEDLQLLVMDDSRFSLPSWPNTLFADDLVKKYATGIAVHWYVDFVLGPRVLNETHYLHPDKFLMYTEACNGDLPGEHNVLLGSWLRGEKYAHSVIETMNNWVTGWVDWNFALDLTGGPNWAKNNVDAAVIVNASADEFYKQPMFYALGHFAKFVPNGSQRVDLRGEEKVENAKATGDVEGIAFVTEENSTVVVLLNRGAEDATAVISDPERGELTENLPANSINTFVYY
ncbi:hypothetical protein J437_LFUL002937 [Ladona fulva]|uniref:Glucosylceramidase n=1 Tax=Ladona fulva TaxID=123851 RepID=A0A8K0K9L3_LADFU|nr:hypothetical protein J437_LFUL002937 [Ladona fulva]